MVTTRARAGNQSETALLPILSKKRISHEQEDSNTPDAKRRKATEEEEQSTKTETPNRASSTRSRQKSDETGSSEDGEPEDSQHVATKPRKHIRFDSDSPPPHRPTGKTIAVVEISVPKETYRQSTLVEDSDDDAAPETISLSVAEAQSLAAQVERRKAKALEKLAKRSARQKRDAELKRQVHGSERRMQMENKRQIPAGAGKIEEKEEKETPPAPEKSYSVHNLPALLPAELLATEAPSPQIVLPTFSSNKSVSEKRALQIKNHVYTPIDIPRQAVSKDLTVNGISVRVTQSKNSLLAAQASNENKHVRESWLRGRTELRGLKSAWKKQKGRALDGKLHRRAVDVTGW